MTDREKAIVMAYTGKCMLTGDKFQIFHKYVEDIMGRPVYTHEMAIKAVDDEIKEKSKADFIALCADESSLEEPCTDAISREDALMALTGEWKESRDEILSLAIRRIRVLPPVTPAEKVGQWINHKDEHQCSQCREIVIADKDIWEEYPYDYCPNCGAKMDVPDNNVGEMSTSPTGAEGSEDV